MEPQQATEVLEQRMGALLTSNPDPAILREVRDGLVAVRDYDPRLEQMLALREHAYQTRISSTIKVFELRATLADLAHVAKDRDVQKRIAQKERTADRKPHRGTYQGKHYRSLSHRLEKNGYEARPRPEVKGRPLDAHGKIRKFVRAPQVAVRTPQVHKPYEYIVDAISLILAGERDCTDYQGLRTIDRQRLNAAQVLRGTKVAASELARANYGKLAQLIQYVK